MKNVFKRTVSLFLCLLILCSCGINKSPGYNIIDNIENATSADYVNAIRSYHVREKNENNKVDNEEFNDFLNDYFVDSYEDDYLSYHFDFYDASVFGIDKPEVTWGEFDPDNDEMIQDCIETVKGLHSFDYNSLSYNQQFAYETLEYSMYETLAQLTLDFDGTLCFTMGSNILINIISNLSDFELRDKESIDDYLLLLADTDRFLYESIDYTDKVANEYNYYLTDFSIDYTEEYIDSFTSTRNNALILSFKERIDDADFVSDSEKKEYISKNNKIVYDEILPAIYDINDSIEKYRGKTTSRDNLLINLDKDLAECTFTLNTSSNKSIDEMFENALDIYRKLQSDFFLLLYDPTVSEELAKIQNGEIEPLNSDYDDMIEFLEDNYTSTHPDLGYIPYTISSLDPNSADPSVLAYYRDSPIDKPDLNIIKYNPNNLEGELGFESYFTIAHESIPGHMYDFYRYFINKENPVMRRLMYIGVTEGYAKYSEMCAATYLDISPKTQDLLGILNTIDHVFDGIMDLAYNYYNYSDEEMKKIFEKIYLYEYNQEYFEDLFESLSGVYSSYGIGFTNLLALEYDTEEKLGDRFDLIEFNDLLTRFGRMPFVIIEDEINKYVEDKLK